MFHIHNVHIAQASSFLCPDVVLEDKIRDMVVVFSALVKERAVYEINPSYLTLMMVARPQKELGGL